MKLSGSSQTPPKTTLSLPSWVSKEVDKNVQQYLNLRETDPVQAKKHLQTALRYGANQVIGAFTYHQFETTDSVITDFVQRKDSAKRHETFITDLKEAIKNMPFLRRWIFYIGDFIESRR